MPIIRTSPVNWVIRERVFISFSQSGRIPDDRWQEFSTALQTPNYSHVVGSGMGAVDLTSLQRKEISAAFKDKRAVAIVDHAIARGIVTALGWLGMQIKGFDWGHVHQAIEFLEPPCPPQLIVDAIFDLRDASLSQDALAQLKPSDRRPQRAP